MLSSAQRTRSANAAMSPRSASSDSSGRIVVCTGWARIAYGARNATNANW